MIHGIQYICNLTAWNKILCACSSLGMFLSCKCREEPQPAAALHLHRAVAKDRSIEAPSFVLCWCIVHCTGLFSNTVSQYINHHIFLKLICLVFVVSNLWKCSDLKGDLCSACRIAIRFRRRDESPTDQQLNPSSVA